MTTPTPEVVEAVAKAPQDKAVEVSESVKLARFFLEPMERFSGQDYAAAFCRIVDWFDGRCSCSRNHVDDDEHKPECSRRIAEDIRQTAAKEKA